MADIAKQNINFSYRPLSFIRDDVEIRKQILNTIIFHQVYFEYGKLQKLGSLLSNSQYGYTASAADEGNCRLLRITDIKESGIYWDGVPFCICDQVEKYAIQNNDILIARTGGTTGKTVLVTYQYIVHKTMRTLTSESINRSFRGSKKRKI